MYGCSKELLLKNEKIALERLTPNPAQGRPVTSRKGYYISNFSFSEHLWCLSYVLGWRGLDSNELAGSLPFIISAGPYRSKTRVIVKI